MTNPNVQIERVGEYSDEVASGIGRLMPALSPRFIDDPIAAHLIEDIVSSPERELFVARHLGDIVGTSTLNALISLTGQSAYLNDFVVDPSMRGMGVGKDLWADMNSWCREQNIGMIIFTSAHHRKPAHQFYLAQGATIEDTAPFHYVVPLAPEA